MTNRSKRRWRAPVRHTLAMVATLALTPAPAGVHIGGDYSPYHEPGTDYLPGTIFRLGHEAVGDYGGIIVDLGSYLTIGGARVHSGHLILEDALSFLQLSGADRSVWISHGGNAFAHVVGGAQMRAAGNCGVGECELVVGGATGGRFDYPPGWDWPITLETGAKGDMVIEGPGSRVTMEGRFRVGQAYVGTGSGPVGIRDGGAVGIVQVLDHGELTTGQALLGIGPSGPGQGGHEQAHGHVVLDGGSRWNIVRNATTGDQSQLRMGVLGDSGLSGDHLYGGFGIYGGSTLFLDGRSGGANPGIIAAGAGPTSHSFMQVHGEGSEVLLAGDTGFIHLGGSASAAGGFAQLQVSGGARVRGLGDGDLVFLNVGRNGFDAAGELIVDGRDTQGRASEVSLSGRGGALGGSAGQSAFLSIGRGGADGTVSLTNGGRIYIGTAAYRDGGTTTGAGFALARDVGSTGRLSIYGPGSELYVFSGDAPAFAAIGQAGLGEVFVGDGGQLQLLGGPLTAPATHRMLVGGGTAMVGHGLLDIDGAGTRVNVGFVDDHLLLVGSGSAGSTGNVRMRNGAALEATVAAFGQGSGNLGRLDMNQGAVMSLSGVMSQGSSSGAALTLGFGGGRGEAVLVGAGTQLTIDSEGSFAGVIAGGTSAWQGGHGQLQLFEGAQLRVQDNGRFDHGAIFGYVGSSDVTVNGAVFDIGGAGRIIVAALPGSQAVLDAVGSATVQAGRLLLIAGQELPDAAGGGLVHDNTWAPQAVNQIVAPGLAPASGQVRIDTGATVRATHLGMALQPDSVGALHVNRGGRLEIGSSAMIGGVGSALVNLDAATFSVAGDAASMVFGGASGSRGDLLMAAGAQAGVLGQQARLVLGEGGTGAATVGGGARLVVQQGADNGGAGAALILGAAPTGVGELRVTGANSRVDVVAIGSTAAVRVGQQGIGRLWIDDAAALDITRQGEPGLSAVLAVGGSPASLVHAAAGSQLSLAGRGNYLVVDAGRATLEGRVDISLTGAPTPAWDLPRLPAGTSAANLPSSAPVVTLRYDGYTPVLGDLVTLISAQDINLGSQPLMSTYRHIDLDGRPAFEFDLGQGTAVFRIEAPAAGLYPALQRVKVDGNDQLGVRFIDQAVFVDFHSASASQVSWKLDAESGVYHPIFGAEGDSLSRGALDEPTRAAVVAGMQTRLWGSEPAWTTTDGNGARLGDAVPIPIFVSTKAGEATPSNAVAVRFAAPALAPDCAPDCLYKTYQGYANDTVARDNLSGHDFRNGRKDGEVLVFADQTTAIDRGSDALAAVAVHELGHAFGLVHTFEPALDGDNLMSYDGGLHFSDLPLRMVEPPTVDGQPLQARQNAMYHLLRYTFGWSEEELLRFGGVPGDLDSASLPLDQEIFFQYDLGGGALAGVQGLTLMLPDGEAMGGGGWAPARQLTAIDGVVTFELIAGMPFYLVGSSGSADIWDVYLKSGVDPTRTGVAGDPVGGGAVLRLDLASQTWENLGDYSFAAAPVPEPSTALTLILGLGTLLGPRIGTGRRRIR